MSERSLAAYSRGLVIRSRTSIDASRWLVAASADILSGLQWRSLRLRGGSEAPEDGKVPHGRLTYLLAALPKDKPKIFAGASIGGTCDLCGQAIDAGQVEYEAEFDAVTVRLDRSCFSMWQSQVVDS
jgi:hypothetical protein